jgi:hypothetical protein
MLSQGWTASAARARVLIAVVSFLAVVLVTAIGPIDQQARAGTELSQDWEQGLKSEIPSGTAIDPLTGKPNQWLPFSGGSSGGGFGEPTQGTQEEVTHGGEPGWPKGVKFFGQGGVETLDNHAADERNLWHIQAEPQNLKISPFITTNLISLPQGDSGALPAPPAGGKNVLWFGDQGSGTFCGTNEEVESNGLNTEGSLNGCTSSGVQEGELVSPPFSLAGAPSAVMHFSSWFEIEGVNANSFDIMEIDYTTNEGTATDPFTWHRLGALNPSGLSSGAPYSDYTEEGQNTPGTWQPILVDLSPAIGNQHVRVRFVFDSVDPLYNGFRGWLLDNVSAVAPSDAGPPQITGVNACAGTAQAPVAAILGNNFMLGATVAVDGFPEGAQTPSSLRLEIPPVGEGTHTVQVFDPNGGAVSNVFTFSSQCVPLPPPPPPPPSPPSGVLTLREVHLSAPVLGKTVNVQPVSGVVFVKLPAGAHLTRAGSGPRASASLSKGVGFVPLTEARQIPVGSTLDTTGGVVALTTATASAKTQFGDFGAGIFTILQDRRQRGLTNLNLVKPQNQRRVCATVGKRAGVASRLSSKVLGRLRGSAHGKFTTRGQYSAATVRGTIWSVTNRCDGTFTQVTRGIVSVRDFVRRRTITLHAGQHYLAKAP